MKRLGRIKAPQVSLDGEDEILQAVYKLWENENERFNIHEGEYEVTVEMPSEEFKCICKILQDFSNTVLGSYDLLLVSLVQPMETATVQTDLTDLVSFSFSLENWYSFAMATSISNTVMIRMSSKLPVMLEYMIEQKGYLRFYLS
ncbi:hypothetical protein HHK36_028905 [Tetracentron sinense]|uniref:Proliferating cell nuclear antigen PCNA C-terminal domain-containing protein n=1 Tax=Tetracentron sinense TaxID=13715 RepID=A0A834YE60_TETSI|nr:hypothetical protein HHK36_028905 [Tetracentron sinense]